MVSRETIKKERRKQKITQSELAREIGVRQATISDFERGKTNIRFDLLKKILTKLNIT